MGVRKDAKIDPMGRFKKLPKTRNRGERNKVYHKIKTIEETLTWWEDAFIKLLFSESNWYINDVLFPTSSYRDLLSSISKVYNLIATRWNADVQDKRYQLDESLMYEKYRPVEEFKEHLISHRTFNILRGVKQ